MSYSHLQRRPNTKSDYQQLMSEWDRLAGNASDAKRQANINGTGAEVQPYIDKMHEISNARIAWIDQYDSIYESLPA